MQITDDMIKYVAELAKLELSDDNKEQAKKDMSDMLNYVNMLNELDTGDIEPMSHCFPVSNVMREDVVTNSNDRDNMLLNAPDRSEDSYVVPKTF